MADDPLDYTAKFNTPLAPDDEVRFQDWLRKNSKKAGRDLSMDLADYDLRGQYKATGGAMIEPGHGTDTWKKPNHPTFSDESIYHGKDGLTGGHWGDGTFTPGATNLQMRKPDQLQQYFRDVEPDVNLILPGAAPPPPSPTQGKSAPMTSSTADTSSLAQLLALIQGGQAPQGQPGGQSPQGMAQIMSMMGGGQQQRPMQPYQMPTGPGMPGSPMPQMGAPGGASMGGQQNIMAMLQGLDPATRLKLMMQMGLIPQGGQGQGAGQGGPMGNVNMSPNPMPGMSPDMSASMQGVRG